MTANGGSIRLKPGNVNGNSLVFMSAVAVLYGCWGDLVRVKKTKESRSRDCQADNFRGDQREIFNKLAGGIRCPLIRAI
jgi:hypothetical protein